MQVETPMKEDGEELQACCRILELGAEHERELSAINNLGSFAQSALVVVW